MSLREEESSNNKNQNPNMGKTLETGAIEDTNEQTNESKTKNKMKKPPEISTNYYNNTKSLNKKQKKMKLSKVYSN